MLLARALRPATRRLRCLSYLASIDQGTSSSRVILYDAETLAPVASHQVELQSATVCQPEVPLVLLRLGHPLRLSPQMLSRPSLRKLQQLVLLPLAPPLEVLSRLWPLLVPHRAPPPRLLRLLRPLPHL